MSDGFIKLSRSLLDWDWHDEPKTGYLYIIMLLLANHEETLWRGETLLRGQLLTGRRQLSIASGLTEDEVRTALGHLKKTGHVIVTAKSKYSVITLPKYDEHCCQPQQIPGKLPDNSPAFSPAESPASAPADPQQIPGKSPTDPHIQELKELKEPKKGLLYPHALPPEDDEDDEEGRELLDRVANIQRADGLIRRYRLTDSEATLDALLEDADAHGFDVLEAALKKASESDNRGGISVNYYRAILRDSGGRQSEGYDPYAGVQIIGGS
ncbi:MAG: hypothetical protein E7321_00165 [Clostridiales bacterium]|nr:hypothetical protein [Clostridiales bacterium]